MKTRAALVVLLSLLAPPEARAGFADSLSGKGGGTAPGGYPGLIGAAPAGAQGGDGQQFSPQKAYQAYVAQQNARKAANQSWNDQRNEAFRIAAERAAEEKRLKEMRRQQDTAAYPGEEAPVHSGMNGYAETPAAPRETAAETPAPPRSLGYPYTSD